MNFLELKLESDVFKNMKNDFNGMLQGLLVTMDEKHIYEGELGIKLKITLSHGVDENNKDCLVPMITYDVTGSYKNSSKKSSAISLPNMVLAVDYDGNYIMRQKEDAQGNLFEQQQEQQELPAIEGVKALNAGRTEAEDAEVIDVIILPAGKSDQSCLNCGFEECESYGSNDKGGCEGWVPQKQDFKTCGTCKHNETGDPACETCENLPGIIHAFSNWEARE